MEEERPRAGSIGSSGEVDRSIVIRDARKALTQTCAVLTDFAAGAEPPSEEELQQRARNNKILEELQEIEDTAEPKEKKKIEKMKKKKQKQEAREEKQKRKQERKRKKKQSNESYIKEVCDQQHDKQIERKEIIIKTTNVPEGGEVVDWWWSGNDIFKEVQVVRHAVTKCKRKNCIEETRKAIEDAIQFDDYFFDAYSRAHSFRYLARFTIRSPFMLFCISSIL